MSITKRYLRVNTATLVSVYVLILIGALVRSLGAGMGCPDWPKCFGEYIPPTSEAGLPANYQEIFLKERVAKNIRLAGTLETFGWDRLADRVRSDESIMITHTFDPTKAWVEYINRLVGVVIGIFVFLNMVFAFKYTGKNWLIPSLGVLIFVLTGFQGWVGSLVVSTNLLPGFITFHMILALLIVILLIWMRLLSLEDKNYMVSVQAKLVLGTLFILLIPQVITGTLTREQVDFIMHTGGERNLIVEQLTGSFFIHRSYSWVLLAMTILSSAILKKNGLAKWANVFAGLVVVEFIVGVGMVSFEMPVFLQPIHLLIATVLLGAVFYLFLRLKTVRV